MYKNKIRQYRLDKQMTLEDLANQVGISIGYLCHLEKGTRSNPSTKTMEKIAKGLKKSVAEVFFDEE